jgi:hypothetical protein
MKYRGVEFNVAQGVEAETWKFSTSMNDKIRRARTRKDATKVVERRIEEALAPKSGGLHHPLRSKEPIHPGQEWQRVLACGCGGLISLTTIADTVDKHLPSVDESK